MNTEKKQWINPQATEIQVNAPGAKGDFNFNETVAYSGMNS